MIQIINLIKQYGINTILRGINFSVPAGELIVLVGGNGAGKSTLLRILTTQLKPTSGEVYIGGWSLPQEANKVRAHIGVVGHTPFIYPDLTSRENLTYFAQLYQLTNPQERVDELLEFVGLRLRGDESVRKFSQGMKQRLSIARAIIHQPDILLLDEPYAGLDQNGINLLDRLLKEEHKNGRTIFLVTHNIAHAFQIADRMLILSRGKISSDLYTNSISQKEWLALYQEKTERHK